MKRKLGVWLLSVVMTTGIFLTVPLVDAVAQTFREEAGTLPDGTAYRMRIPPNWNKVLISDLDYAAGRNSDNERNMYLLERGYAVSGTARHPRREFEYDPVKEISRLLTVVDMFEAKFGKPERVIQYGHSGGGYVALAMAETRPDRINAAIDGCGHVPVWLGNTMLDGWFALKVLIAPDLQIADLPEDVKLITEQWRKALEAAQQTSQGRARIALAVTLGQWPAWTSEKTPKPDPKDVVALQRSMYETVLAATANPGGNGRFMFEHAGGGQPSWNTGIDYKKFFANGNEFNRRAVRALYSEAGLDLGADLNRINAAPRISAKPSALDFWSGVPGRTIQGMPRVPVLRFHTIGDLAVPISLLQGYEAKIRANGRDNWYRAAIVDRPGHCTFTAAESMAAIETVIRRLDTGRWHAEPEDLTKLGTSYNKGDTRFIKFEHNRYNRAWFPGLSSTSN